MLEVLVKRSRHLTSSHIYKRPTHSSSETSRWPCESRIVMHLLSYLQDVWLHSLRFRAKQPHSLVQHSEFIPVPIQIFLASVQTTVWQLPRTRRYSIYRILYTSCAFIRSVPAWRVSQVPKLSSCNFKQNDHNCRLISCLLFF
jgi:hypothetical protein